MKSKLGFASAMLLASMMIPAPAAEAKLVDGTIRGTLTDSMCKGNHSGMIKMGGYGTNAVSCVKKCLEQGSKLVLMDRKTKAVYTLVNPAEAQKFAGEDVVISGHIDHSMKIIHVHGIKQG